MTRRCLLRIGGRRVGRGAVSVIGSRWSLVLLGLLFVAVQGDRSSRGADGIAGQTAEPPIARPAAPRHAGGIVPATTTPAIRPVTAGPLPPTSTVGLPTVAALPVSSAVPAVPASIPKGPA